jgi:hypothetical protein
MNKRNEVKLVCLSLLVGAFLSGFLLRFLFGTSIYTEPGWQILAPSANVFGPGSRANYLDRAIATAFDTVVFAAVIYTAVYPVMWCSRNR